MKITSDLHIVPRLGMSGAKPLLPVYAFMAWTVKTLYIHFFFAGVIYALIYTSL
jgi:hypothetical protein